MKIAAQQQNTAVNLGTARASTPLPHPTTSTPSLLELMAQWRAAASDETHLSAAEQRLQLEIRQGQHALRYAQKTYAAYREQTEAELQRLRDEVACLRDELTQPRRSTLCVAPYPSEAAPATFKAR